MKWAYIFVGIFGSFFVLSIMAFSATAPKKLDYLKYVDTYVGVTQAYTEYEICNPTDIGITTSKKAVTDFDWYFDEIDGKINDVWFEIKTSESYMVTESETIEKCHPYEVINKTGTVVEKNCTYSYKPYTVERHRQLWERFDPTHFTFKPKQCYNIRIYGAYDNLFYTDGLKVDHVLKFAGHSFDEYAWWDASYGFRYEILSNATISGLPISVNDTYMINSTAYWTNNATSSETIYVYCENSGCLTGAIAIANETSEKFWEREDLGTGNNPTSVWSLQINASNIHHFSTSLFDSSGNSNPIAIHTGNPTYNTSGKFLEAMDFSSDSLTFNFTLGTNPAAEWTIETWVYIQEPAAEGYILSMVAADSMDGFNFITEDVGGGNYKIACYDRDNIDYIPADEPYTVGQWYYAVCMKNTTHLMLYINGTLQSDVSPNTALVRWNTNNPIIGAGRTGAAKYFGGMIDEVRLWERELSQAEITDNWRNGINTLTALGGEEPREEHDVDVDLFINGTQGNNSLDVGGYVNFTVVANISATVNLDTDYPDFTTQSGTSPLSNYTYLDTISNGNLFNITGYFTGNSTHNAASETFWLNVTVPTVAPPAVAADYGVLINFITSGFKNIMVR